MSMEERVREWHALQDRVSEFAANIRQFREEARRMSVRSLEIVIAQLIDRLNGSLPEEKQLDLRFKLLLLQPIYDSARTSPPKKRGFLRGIFDPPPPFAEEIVTWRIPYPIPITEPIVSEWANTDPIDVSRMLPARPSVDRLSGP